MRRLLFMSLWDPALVFYGAGFLLHRRWPWFLAFCLTMAGHKAVEVYVGRLNSLNHLHSFFHEFQDPSGEYIFGDKKTEYVFREIPPEDLVWKSLKSMFPNWKFVHREWSRGNGKFGLKELFRLDTPLNPPVRVFQASRPDGNQLPRASAYVNTNGVSIIFVTDGWDGNDIHHKFMLLHEMEHVNLNGQKNLARRKALAIWVIATASILFSSSLSW